MWESDACDDTPWEVVCAECGDDEGPAQEQSGSVRKLRGPYRNKHKAQRVAHRHERRESGPLGWIPGSTARIPA